MSKEDLLILKVENVKQRGKFYTLRLTAEEYDSFWEWKNKNYKRKPRRQ